MSEQEIYYKVINSGILKEHNIEAYIKVAKMFETENRVCIEQATGTGKSFIALQLMYDNHDKKIIYLVPRNGIGDQVEEHIMSLSEDARKKYFPNLEIRTYQSLLNLTKEELKSLDVDYLITDEYHHLGSPEWGGRIDIITSSHPNLRIFGMTATPTRGLGTKNEEDMSQTFFNGNVASRLTLADAIAKGILKAPRYITTCYNFEEEIEKTKTTLEKKNLNEETKNEYLKEIEVLYKKAKTLVNNAPSFNDILKANLKPNGKYIIFCPRAKLEETMSDAEQWLTKITDKQNVKTYFATSSMIRESRINQEEFYNDHDDSKLRIMFAMDMYNEGIHVPDIDGVIMLRPSKSDIIFYQQLGRALACNPEAERPLVIDFVNNIYQIRSLLKEIKASKENNDSDITRVEHNLNEDSSIYFDIDINEIELLEQLLEFENKISLSSEEKTQEFIEFLNEGLIPGSKLIKEKNFSNGDKVGSFGHNNKEKILEYFNSKEEYKDKKYDIARNILYPKKIDKISEFIEFLNEGLTPSSKLMMEKNFSNGDKVGKLWDYNKEKILEYFNGKEEYQDEKYDVARNILYPKVDKIAEFIEFLNEGLTPTSKLMMGKNFSNGDKVGSFGNYNKEKILEYFNKNEKYQNEKYDVARNILYPKKIDKISEFIEFLNEGLTPNSKLMMEKSFSNGDKVNDFGKYYKEKILEYFNSKEEYKDKKYDVARNILYPKEIDKIAEFIEFINEGLTPISKLMMEKSFSNGDKVGIFWNYNKEKILEYFNKNEKYQNEKYGVVRSMLYPICKKKIDKISEFIEFINEGLSPYSRKIMEKNFSNGDKVGGFWSNNKEKILEYFNSKEEYKDKKYDVARNILYPKKIDKISEFIEFLNEGLTPNSKLMMKKKFSNGDKVNDFGKYYKEKILEYFNSKEEYKDKKYDVARNMLYPICKKKIDKIAEFIEFLNEGLTPTSKLMMGKNFSNEDKVGSFWSYNKEKILDELFNNIKYEIGYDLAKKQIININSLKEILASLNVSMSENQSLASGSVYTDDYENQKELSNSGGESI